MVILLCVFGKLVLISQCLPQTQVPLLILLVQGLLEYVPYLHNDNSFKFLDP